MQNKYKIQNTPGYLCPLTAAAISLGSNSALIFLEETAPSYVNQSDTPANGGISYEYNQMSATRPEVYV